MQIVFPISKNTICITVSLVVLILLLAYIVYKVGVV